MRLDFVPFQELAQALEILFESFRVFLEALPNVNVLGICSLVTPKSVYLFFRSNTVNSALANVRSSMRHLVEHLSLLLTCAIMGAPRIPISRCFNMAP